MKYKVNLHYKLRNPERVFDLELITNDYYKFITTDEEFLQKDTLVYGIATEECYGKFLDHDVDIIANKEDKKTAFIYQRNITCEIDGDYMPKFIDLLPRFYLIVTIKRDDKMIFNTYKLRERINENNFDNLINQSLEQRIIKIKEDIKNGRFRIEK